jgi:hypothetical protein
MQEVELSHENHLMENGLHLIQVKVHSRHHGTHNLLH